jgi:flavin reductase (DIM6/NTAB) family NADH-FMN oxidoreductase RutF
MHVPPVVSAHEYRKVLGRFATGVVVATSFDEAGDPHGMTANGFTSVSLKPPLILLSVGVNASTHTRLTARDDLGISILGSDQKADAQRFAGRRAGDFHFEWFGDVPVIAGAIGQLRCHVVDRFAAGDHTLFIAQIEDMRCIEERDPLLFFAGLYRDLSGSGPEEEISL